ncbi:Gmad2 immunoglobulin-like domain-containing protein [Fulvivirga ulvae]|uniref:Gmad2 immunoglobulin-like domain-containing protein n=1 Tax=Fulvivirga ulvae TaxID=2904245 RepID=UPI001F214D6F|nr:Gmad2 immunoglobulin-like domain-containing protein [Fulvivirga ulvae]UII31793.1 Gmad2 immunoglobulin-like domain-containing protein [Fulvivirga ulvae]
MRKYLMLVIGLLHIYACDVATQQTNSEQSGLNAPDSQTLKLSEGGQVVDRTYDWQSYKNNHYRISVEYPEQWRVIESTQNPDIPVINIYSKEFDNGFKLPLMIHEDARVSHLSFYPKGLGVDGPAGATISLSDAENNLPIPFQLDSSETKAYQLNDGEVWGYYLKPEKMPKKNWTADGFIFVQVQISDHQLKCFDKSGREKPINQCNTLGGNDRMVRYGKVDEGDLQLIKQMLRTLKFVDTGKPVKPLADLIKVENISKNDTVRPPVVIKGKARGPWFFEGQFPVEVANANHKTIAKDIAKAEGKWMTSEWVNFEVTLDFAVNTESQQGYITLRRSNASGKAELDRSFTLPVIIDGQ